MAQVNTELIPLLNQSLDISLPVSTSREDLINHLSSYINMLIETDFQKLVSILYRVDVSESKLSGLLNENPGTDAGSIIAELIIERQLQKIKSRQQYSRPENDISEDEKW